MLNVITFLCQVRKTRYLFIYTHKPGLFFYVGVWVRYDKGFFPLIYKTTYLLGIGENHGKEFKNSY